MTDPAPSSPLQRNASFAARFGRLKEWLVEASLVISASISIAVTVGIVFVLLNETVIPHFGGVESKKPFFQLVSPVEFFTQTRWTPQFADKHFGVIPLVAGTFMVAGIAAMFGLPFGILSAVYLSEYATPKTRNIIKPLLEMLAGVPTVVYGYFALKFVTPIILKPIFGGLFGMDVEQFNALSGGIVVGIMIMPMVCSLTEDALRAVPKSLREAGYALGATKYDVSVKVVVPAAFSGIVASFLLAISRAIGETMAVAIACGNNAQLTMNPLKSMQTMTAFVVNLSLGEASTGTVEYKSIYAVALTLFCITLAMNIISQRVMRKYREVYQ
jgi:phosphate transport system permease protein